MPSRPIHSRHFHIAIAVVAVLLVAVAALVARSLDAHATHEAQVDAWLAKERVLSRLSSTMPAAERAELTARVTAGIGAALAPVDRERAAARRELELARPLGALFALLAAVGTGVAVAALRRADARHAELEASVAALQTHDALTGLPNRRFFSDWLAFAIANARRDAAHVGVLYIDIGGLGEVAEHHGGVVAEALLVEIARRFRASAREGDVFARLGPTEFAVATPDAQHVRDLAMAAQRLRDVLHDPALPPLADTPIGTSIGIAFYPEDAGDSAGVMAAANAAMYAARRAGFHHVAFSALAA